VNHILAAIAAVLIFTAGVGLGSSWAIATRTYRDARATTRAARALWRQVPRDWARVGNVLGGLFIVAFVGYAYYLGSR
jgi:hypothetical protein